MTGGEPVNDNTAESVGSQSDWPVFSIHHTYNPQDIAPETTFEANEVVMYDATSDDDERWISAKYGSYVEISEIR